MTGPKLSLSPSNPVLLSLTISVVFLTRSRTNTSVRWFLSLWTSVLASASNAT